MPFNRYNRVQQRNQEDNFFNQLPIAYNPPRERNNHVGVTGQVVYCCTPGQCDRLYTDPIHVADPGDAVKVLCNNDQCPESKWMHNDCFVQWEQQVLTYLRSCGRARSWSEKQRLQNLWTKKGYDLAYKACDCKCQRGHLRKDLNYLVSTPALDQERRGKRHNKGKSHKPLPSLQQKGVTSSYLPIVPSSSNNVNNISSTISTQGRIQLRVRTSSFSSTGSSPPSSAGTPPLTPGSGSNLGNSSKNKSTFEFFEDAEQAAAGNIFQRRMNYTAFKVLPIHQQNPYHIKMEDEGPYGNDEIRCFVLSNLSSQRVTSVACVACQQKLTVYDRYPLIDGTFFLSPQRYNTDFQVMQDGRLQYMNAVCMRCLEGSCPITCRACHKAWSGSALVIGTMYAYDIFAASPCCSWRMSCKQCQNPLLDTSNSFQFYSEYSRPIECRSCRSRDHHFVRPLHDAFIVKLKSSMWD